MPTSNYYFNFDKVSKRTHLDIASANSAVLVTVDDGCITDIHLSAGGVAPYPFYLKKTAEYLRGKSINFQNLEAANRIIQEEIAPIGDVRGSAKYKRLLLRQLFYHHFLTLFPDAIHEEDLLR